MTPTDFTPHARGDNRRFHVRTFGAQWQVHAIGQEHLAMCTRRECAEMIADALEFHARELDIRQRCSVEYRRLEQ